MALRGFTYQAVGQLAARVPGLFRRDAAVAEQFFRALSTERAGVRAALQEAVSSLAIAHQDCTGGH
jgi:proteasome component ECM29